MVGDRCEKLNRNYIGIDIEFREGEPNHDNKKRYFTSLHYIQFYLQSVSL